MKDVGVAIREYLLSNNEVSALVDDRVFVAELPESEHGAMPRACVLLMEAGGAMIFDYEHLSIPRFDIFCYGKNRMESAEVDAAVWDALHYLRRANVANTLVYSVNVGGRRLFKVADTGWPVSHRACQVLASIKDA